MQFSFFFKKKITKMLNKQEFRQNYHKKTNIIKNYNNKNRQNTHKNKINRKNLCKYRKSLFTD